MRYFHGLLFLGSIHSKAEADFLRKRFEGALELSGYLQQPDHPESEAHAERCRLARILDERELEETVRDIAVALLGRSVTFGDQLPYPWDTGALEDAIGRPPVSD